MAQIVARQNPIGLQYGPYRQALCAGQTAAYCLPTLACGRRSAACEAEAVTVVAQNTSRSSQAAVLLSTCCFPDSQHSFPCALATFNMATEISRPTQAHTAIRSIAIVRAFLDSAHSRLE